MALRFGLVGIAIGLPLALLTPLPVLRVVGVAMVPLMLRTYIGSLLSLRANRSVWCVAAT